MRISFIGECMSNSLLTPHMIAREIACIISNITNAQNNNLHNLIRSGIIGNVCYNGIVININKYDNDEDFYFDINYKHIKFTITIPANRDLLMCLDDFANRKLVSILYNKLEAFGYATWD